MKKLVLTNKQKRNSEEDLLLKPLNTFASVASFWRKNKPFCLENTSFYEKFNKKISKMLFKNWFVKFDVF